MNFYGNFQNVTYNIGIDCTPCNPPFGQESLESNLTHYLFHFSHKKNLFKLYTTTWMAIRQIPCDLCLSCRQLIEVFFGALLQRRQLIEVFLGAFYNADSIMFIVQTID